MTEVWYICQTVTMKYIPDFELSSNLKNKSGYHSGNISVILLLIVSASSLILAFSYTRNNHFFNNFWENLFRPQRKVETIQKVAQPTFSATASQPSQRALKVAAWTYSNAPAGFIDELIKTNPSLSGSTPTEIVNSMAIFLDNNPTNLVLLEADHERYMQSGTQSSTGYLQYSSINTSLNNYQNYQQAQKAKCQEEINTYTLCTSELAKQTAEYQNCLANPTYVGVIQRSCAPPSKTCYKPLCTSYNY